MSGSFSGKDGGADGVGRYINHKNTPVLRAFFPNMRLEELDTGHWGKSARYITAFSSNYDEYSARGEA